MMNREIKSIVISIKFILIVTIGLLNTTNLVAQQDPQFTQYMLSLIHI